jgi:signal transduction histidine kinase
MRNQEKLISVETQRINSLRKHQILDTPSEQIFDHLTELAAKALEVPIALISLVDSDRIWFKSRYGLEIEQIKRYGALSDYAILSDEINLVEDTLTDSRFLSNRQLATLGLRFYAGFPLKDREGNNLGTFCVLDKKPRKFTEHQKDILQGFAKIVIDEMDLRLAARTAVLNQNESINIFGHDLKNPVTSILVAAELMKEQETLDEASLSQLIDYIIKGTKKIIHIIDDSLETARNARRMELHFNTVDFGNVIKKVIDANQMLAKKKKQKIEFKIESESTVLADESKLFDIVNNVLGNAIKFSGKNTTITITLKKNEGNSIMELQDQGQGLTEEDMQNLFYRFRRLSAKPTGEETSSGFGLSIVKLLVEAHHGVVWAESDGKDKGAKFIVQLPCIK